MLRHFCIGTALLLGLGAAANGLFMLVSPAAWYFTVPGVTTTGPFNQHFIRDIGLIFLLLGGAFIAGAVLPRHRIAAWGASSLWLAGHALFHFWEVAVGICGPSAIPRDFPAVTLPAILGALLTFWAIADARSTSHPPLESVT
ncbi:hypothetical protein [Emcibacter sp. SYSU 3D8]|uniref:hypothetical protein n=1 Tax=Emcibacter sp. SYSU 3D8 TaxID=3133969 RepID=UPI0031FF21CB